MQIQPKHRENGFSATSEIAFPLSVRSLSVRHGLGSASASPCAGGHGWGSHWIAVLHRLQGSNALDRGSRPYKRRYTRGLLKRPGVI